MVASHLYSLYLGGALHAGWAGFHLLFPRVFKWQTRLKEMDPVNRAIYQVMNICLVFWFAAAAYLSLVFGPEMLSSALGRKLAVVMGAFWLLRFGLQQKFFLPWRPVSLIISAACLLTAGCYLYPIWQGVH